MPIITTDEEGELFDSGGTQEKCPDCGAAQMWRRGPWKNRFLACSRFPKCKWTSYRKKDAAPAFPEQQTAA